MTNRTAVIFLLASLAACAGAPVQEMSDARQAVRAAQAAGAGERAPAELASAQQLIDEAQQHLQRHEYRQAQEAALEARQQAVRALEVSRQAAGSTN
jgi:hypothetical protein